MVKHKKSIKSFIMLSIMLFSIGAQNTKILAMAPSEENVDIEISPASVSGSSIAIFVGGVLVGYVIAEVADGVVASITGTDGLSDYVKQKLNSLIGQPYKSSLFLSGSSDGSGGDGGTGGFSVSYLQ